MENIMAYLAICCLKDDYYIESLLKMQREKKNNLHL